MISDKYGELHAAVRSARYFETEATITATGAASYALPTDWMETVNIDFQYTSTTRRPLRLIPAAERSRWAGQTGDAFRYALEAGNIVLYPNPSSGTYKHLYIPQPTDLSSSADSTSVDVISVHGEKFIINAVAAMARDNGETDNSDVMRDRDQAMDDVLYYAAVRVLENPRTPDPDYRDDILDPAEWWRPR